MGKKDITRNNRRKTVKDCINDAYLQLDYDDTLVTPKDTPSLWNKAIRLFDPIATEIMRYRNWSFLDDFMKIPLGTSPLPMNVEVGRVVDDQGRVWTRVSNPNPGACEYYINNDEITTGYMPEGPGWHHHHHHHHHELTVEYQEYMPEAKTGKEPIHPKLYDAFVLGLSWQLAKTDQAFRDTAEEKEVAFHGTDSPSARKGILFNMAVKDQRQAGDAIIYGRPKTRRYLDYKKFPEGRISPWM